MTTATAHTNGTERTLVIVKYEGLIVQVAYRDPVRAAEHAAQVRGMMGVQDVQVDTVPNHRGRRVTRVIL